MKRGRPMKREKRLQANPEKVREFLQRGRGGWQKPVAPPPAGSLPGGLPSKPGLKRKRRARPPEGPLSPAEWRAAVFKASDGRCSITNTRALDVDDPRFHCHHMLAKRELRARGLFAWVWDPRNGILLRRDVHVRHEDAFERVPAEKLPAAVWEFCAELDALEGTRWASELVLRVHPAGGVRRRP